ncbi:glycosyltransferase family 2 protein [Microvirga alba]|uniref:Glycosyltransferase family 2 protein n=1 Tax=Microvirga alba TaxID=2791025 RepID=A0A931FRE6_9HYPH|nr:glycosyltransferase family 2 protein [Microvirga alba]MBF9235687.1 glycosyltransferase family 2 protein [Microvirga alba]
MLNLEIVAITISLIVIFPASYLLLLSLAALVGGHKTAIQDQNPVLRFAFVIPAHDEETTLPRLITSLNQLNYPAELFRIYVAADNCTDRTAELARDMGAIVYERNDTINIGKGHVLRWALERVLASEAGLHGVVIVDADSSVSRNFLCVISSLMARGENAVQAYYAVQNASSSWSAGLRAIALAALHYIRPLGLVQLGGSAGLNGNGMALSVGLARQHCWPSSLTEDLEYHAMLLLAGERVAFAPDAIVEAEMPNSLKNSYSQNVRWERGRMDVAVRYLPKLLRKAFETRLPLFLLGAAEQAIPPLALLGGAMTVATIAAFVSHSTLASSLALFVVSALTFHVLISMRLARLPLGVCASLLMAPIYLAWKLWLFSRLFMGLDRDGWVRTPRN